MFKFKCPRCDGEIEAQDEWEGQTANCPHCGESIKITRRLRPSVAIHKNSEGSLRSVPRTGWKPKETEGTDDGYCFWLGFWYGFFGIIVAAIIEGKDGVKRARSGMSLGVLCLILLAAIALFLRQMIFG